MSTSSHRFNDKLFLVRQQLSKSGTPPKPVEQKAHHIAIIDCSGSMSGDLPQVRAQLKAKLPKILGPSDTMTLIWFSGRGQFGVLVEAEPVATLTDLQAVNKAIDRWLAPVGLTGFKEPIEEAHKVIDRVKAKDDGVFSLFFMSDGHDNQWNRAEILKAVEAVASKCAASTFVEYGYYADRQLLASMAEKAGGAHVFAEDFPKYEPMFSAVMQKKIVGGKRVAIDVKGDPIGGFAFGFDDEDLLTFAVEGGEARVPEHLKELFYISPALVGTDAGTMKPFVPAMEEFFVAATYAALALYAVRMKPDVVYGILKQIGDVDFIERFSGCFGKQKYSEFTEAARTAAFDAKARYTKGYDPSKVPDDDAFTLLELVNMLAKDDIAHILLDHDEFRYSRISRARVDADGEKALRFVANPEPDGYPIASLTYNEERPNISLLVRKEGTIDLTDRIAAHAGTENFGALTKLPSPFPTYIWRNYAIIRDGLVNVEKLPVKVSDTTRAALAKAGVRWTTDNDVLVLDLKPLPIINRRMVKEASAATIFDLEWQLTVSRAMQKVFNTYRKELFPKESRGYKLVYGESAATWLQEEGITDFNGFSPRMVQAEAKDFYIGKQLEVKLKGYATLPSVKEVKEKMAKGKLTGCAALMAPAVKLVEDFLAQNEKAAIREMWLDGQQKARVAETRLLLGRKAQQLFTVIVGQIWFKEWSTLDENTLTIRTPEGEVLGTALMKEIEIKV